jgi:ACS family hexuronate transporter-like MFS transporter
MGDPLHHGLPRPSAWLVALVATLAMTVSYVDRQALATLAPTVCAALRIDHAQYGALTAAFSLSYFVGAPLAGWLLDRVGARRGLVVSIVLWSGVSALHAAAPSFAGLLALRVLLGAAEAPSFPGAAQTVRRALPEGDRSTGYGLIFTGSSIGAMIAAPLAIGLNAHLGSWRLAFVGTSLCGLAWLPLWLFATGGARRRVFDAPAHTRAPDVPWRVVLREPAIHRAVLLVFLTAPLTMFVLNWSAQLLVEHFHQTQDVLSKYLWLPPLFFDVGAVGCGAIASRRERSRLRIAFKSRSELSLRSSVRTAFESRSELSSHKDLVAVGAVLAAALAIVPFVGGPVAAVLLGGVAMLGGGALYLLATEDMLGRLPTGLVSRAGGCTAAAQSIAHILFAPAIGAVLDRTRSYTLVLVVLGLMVVPGAIAWAMWPVRARS